MRTCKDYLEHLQALGESGGAGDAAAAPAAGGGGASATEVARQLKAQHRHLLHLALRLATDAEGDAARVMQGEALACELRHAVAVARREAERLRPEAEAAPQLRERNAKLRRESEMVKGQAKELKARVREQLGALVDQNKQLR